MFSSTINTKEDLQEGLWFFVDSYKNNQSLNHLKHKVPCYEAEIPDNIMVYDCNLEKIVIITDSLVQWGHDVIYLKDYAIK